MGRYYSWHSFGRPRAPRGPWAPQETVIELDHPVGRTPDVPVPRHELDDLHDELDRLRAENAALRAELAVLKRLPENSG